MTGKEIIINGVDVNKCRNYDPEQYFECEISSCHCEEITNCYFKQLKRKEQKLKEITEYCNSCNLKADFTACDILQILEGKKDEK